MRGQFPAAEITAGASVESSADLREALSNLPAMIEHVLSQMTAHPAATALPIDVRATAFQTRVWHALKSIPRGETRSYSEVAREMGMPSAVRAVARACASNPVALVIPCHRGVASDGKLSGYRWGLDRKRRLLEVESGRALPDGGI